MKFSPLCLLAVSSMTSIASAFLGSHTVPVSTCTGTGTGTRTTFYYSNSSLFANNNNNKVVRKPNSAVEITITAPCSATSAAFDKACSELSRTVNIPGFRKGAKIPPQVLESAMAAKGGRTALRAEAIKALVGELLESALKEEGVQPIGQPNLVISAEELAEKFVPGEEIDILVSCDVWPELKWKGDYKGLKASYERKSFDQAKFDKAIEDLRERYAETSKIEDPNVKLEMGNACTVNMVGYMSTTDGEKGEALPNAASGDNVEVVLGKGRYMEGLVEGLVGAGVGETKTVTVSFPQNLRDKSLAGKKAIFDVTVLEASARTLPVLDDEFAAKVRPDLTKESLEEELRKAIDEEDSKEFIGVRNKALSDALAEVVDVEVPDTIVTQQAKDKYAHMMAEMREGGTSDAEIKNLITPENFQKYKDIVAPDIVKDFKISLATDSIAEKERVQVPSDQVDEQMGALRKEAESSGEEYDEAAFRPKVESTMMRKFVFDFLADNADLDVVYTDQEEPQFDAGLMEKLADDSIAREQDLVDSSTEDSGKSSILSKNPVEIEAKKGDIEESELVADEPRKEASVETEAKAVETRQKMMSSRLAREAKFRILNEADVAEAKSVEVRRAMMEDRFSNNKKLSKKQTSSPVRIAAKKYEDMSEEDRAFSILVDLGIIGLTPDPDNSNYDATKDDEFCSEYDTDVTD